MSQIDTAKRMSDAAGVFLQALDAGQQQKAQLDFSDTTERKNWHYIPRDRAGLSVKEMDAKQRQLAHALVATGVSSTGYEKVKTIMSLEDVLAEIEGEERRFIRDPELYYLSIFGTPAGDEPWGWRFEGHHISLNYTVVAGELVGPTPLFFGSNPGQVRHGEQEGLRALKEEEDLGRQLLHELDGTQQSQAIISVDAPADILTTNVPHIGDEVRPEGLAGADMSESQRQVLRALVEVYVGRLPETYAAAEMERIAKADLRKAYFAWAGVAEVGGPHYYRVQGPMYVAEYDNTQNDANHIHAVWRDLQKDFGEDVLRDHLRQGHV
ncbi:MAG: hypothetical protein ACI906_004055 [Candidatus Latescibacterota bacterium]|jgi:hypothetical protein